MKIQGAKKVHYDSGPNMTPLVDVVMVILIFMMLSASFAGAEHYLVSDVPVQAKGVGAKQPEGAVIPTKFTINVQQRGTFFVAKAGNFATVNSEAGSQAYDVLKAQLAQQFKSFQDAGIKPADMLVIIYPTNSVDLQNLVTVYQAVYDAGFTKVSFGVGG
jgi:biopolymer transport protein ExbD